MLIKWVNYLPEILLLLNFPIMLLINEYRRTKTSKTFYSVAKYILLASFIATIMLKSQTPLPQYLQNDSYILLYKLLLQLFGLVIFFLGCKWFLNKNRNSFSYYALGIGSILCLSLMVSTPHMLILTAAYFAASLHQYKMLSLSEDDYDYEAGARRYFVFIFIFSLMMLCGAEMFYEKIGSWQLSAVKTYYLTHPLTWYDITAMACLILPLLYMIGVAPLHFGLVEYSGISIIPVCMFRIILPIIGAYGVLMHLSADIFKAYAEILSNFYEIIGIISLFLGAVSAMKEENIRRLFVYCGLNGMGFILLAALPLNANGVSSSMVFFLAYLITMSGIYTALYAFKSNGEYLTQLSDIGGVFMQKPYVSVLLTIFIVSLAGSPPMIGFLGKLQAVDNMVINHEYWQITVAMLASLLLVNAYFRIVRTMFFEPRVKNYDRADKGIYLSLFINIVICVCIVLNPAWPIGKIEAMLTPLMR